MKIKQFKVIIMILALISPLNVYATLITTGQLTYDTTTSRITSTTGKTYLALDLLASTTYVQTVAATSSTGIYSNYHIAEINEAFEFFNLASGTNYANIPGTDQALFSSTPYSDGAFGHNFTATEDAFFFKGDNADSGFVIFKTSFSNVIADTYRSFSFTDRYSSIGINAATPISWLLVNNNITTAVPLPAAVWFMGCGLLGLLCFSHLNTKRDRV